MIAGIAGVWQRLWLLPLMILGLLAVISFVMMDLGRFLSSPVFAPVPADLIAALGGGWGERERQASDLFMARYAPRIFLTGPEAGRTRKLLGQGVPASAILADGKSRHSWDEAMNTYHLMMANGWKSVLVVSDPPHMRRLSWIWEHVFVGSGMTFRLIPAPMPGWDAAHWWRDVHSAAFVRSELLKLLFYQFRYGSEGLEFDLPRVRAGK